EQPAEHAGRLHRGLVTLLRASRHERHSLTVAAGQRTARHVAECWPRRRCDAGPAARGPPSAAQVIDAAVNRPHNWRLFPTPTLHSGVLSWPTSSPRRSARASPNSAACATSAHVPWSAPP